MFIGTLAHYGLKFSQIGCHHGSSLVTTEIHSLWVYHDRYPDTDAKINHLLNARQPTLAIVRENDTLHVGKLIGKIIETTSKNIVPWKRFKIGPQKLLVLGDYSHFNGGFHLVVNVQMVVNPELIEEPAKCSPPFIISHYREQFTAGTHGNHIGSHICSTSSTLFTSINSNYRNRCFR